MKLFATDYDGTVTYRGVTPEFREALDVWRSRGNLFGIVTGRPITNIHATLRDVKLPYDFAIADNGGVICDAKKQCLFSAPMDARDAADVVNIMRELPHSMFRISNRTGNTVMDFAPRMTADEEHGAIVSDLLTVKDVTEFFFRFDSPETNEEAKRRLQESFEGKIRGASSSRLTTDFVRADTSKSAGILKLTELLNLHPEKIYTTGDAFNDLDMLVHPSFEGYAVANAMPEVIRAVGRSVDSPLEILTKCL